MNNQHGNRDKRIAVLLIAAFAWLFIGSLIIFHEEHVLGKHFTLSNQLFISPKSNDKKDISLDLQKSLLKFQDQGTFTGILSDEVQAGILRLSFESRFKESSSTIPDDAFLILSSLRAPPAA